MLRPSTAPRWNNATSTLRLPGSAAAAARSKKGGAPAKATSAQAPDRTNVLRVSMDALTVSPPLELGRPEHERDDLLDVGVHDAIVRRRPPDLRVVELAPEDVAGGRRGLPMEHAVEHTVEDGARIADVDATGQRRETHAHTTEPVLRQLEGEVHPRQQRPGV